MTTSRSEVELWRAPELQAELLRGRFIDFEYGVHTHETACFALLTRGAIRIRMRGREFIARAGDLYAIDADEPHAGWPVDAHGWQQRTLYVDLAHLRRLAGDERVAAGASLAAPLLQDRELADLLYAVHRCSQVDGPALLRDQAYVAFAARLVHRHVRGPRRTAAVHPEHAAVRTARHYLDAHLGDHVSLGEVAGAAGLPPFQLLRAFERSQGMTPHAYQRQARVRLAMRLIRERHALREVGAQVGFADQAHLTRWFRRLMGITPGQYRRAVLDERLS